MSRQSGQALPDSHLLSFIDNTQTYVLTFLEGQKLMQDIVLMQPKISGELALYRQAVLGFQHFVHFFKENEQLGFYFESDAQEFAFKLESSPLGHTRCVMVNNSKSTILPDKWTGIARFMVSYPQSKREPVQSVVRVTHESIGEIFNQMLRNAMQINAVIRVSESSDQSIMLTRLPDLGGKTVHPLSGSMEGFLKQNQSFFDNLWQKALTDPEIIKTEIQNHGFQPLRVIPFRFFCPCSHERMLANVAMLWARSEPDLFSGQESLEIKCDFCNAPYLISYEDAEDYVRQLNQVN